MLSGQRWRRNPPTHTHTAPKGWMSRDVMVIFDNIDQWSPNTGLLARSGPQQPNEWPAETINVRLLSLHQYSVCVCAAVCETNSPLVGLFREINDSSNYLKCFKQLSKHLDANVNICKTLIWLPSNALLHGLVAHF